MGMRFIASQKFGTETEAKLLCRSSGAGATFKPSDVLSAGREVLVGAAHSYKTCVSETGYPQVMR